MDISKLLNTLSCYGFQFRGDIQTYFDVIFPSNVSSSEEYTTTGVDGTYTSDDNYGSMAGGLIGV